MSTLTQKDDAEYMRIYEAGRADAARELLRFALTDALNGALRWMTPSEVGVEVGAALIHQRDEMARREADAQAARRKAEDVYVPPAWEGSE